MGNVADLSLVREKRRLDDAIARGKVPLSRTHMEDGTDLTERIARIKNSLEKINMLMRELRENGK